MPANLTSAVFLALAMTLQTAPPPTTPTPRPANQSAARPGSVVLTVTNEKGDLLSDATITVRGAVDRGGTSGSDGIITLQNMPAGTYRLRITRDGFITLDKEVTIKAGTRATADAVLSAAPPPPPPPPPPPAPVEPRPANPAGTPGVPKVLSLIELIEQMLKDTQPMVEREIGCSFVTSSKLIVARDPISLHRHADADEIVYIVAGEAMLRLGDKDQVVSAGWFSLVPRGLSHSLTRRGRNPLVVLSIQSGQPCGK